LEKSKIIPYYLKECNPTLVHEIRREDHSHMGRYEVGLFEEILRLLQGSRPTKRIF